MNRKSLLTISAFAALTALGGCASAVKAPPQPQAQPETQAPAPTPSAPQASAVAPASAPAQDNLGPASDVSRSVYFAFDKYQIQDKYRPVIDGNAQYLASHPNAHVQLQGNCDARGSREYNMALGQKRAESVLDAMKLLGAQPSQMEAISFGKEKPKATGTTEADYAENRRTDIVYQK